MTISRTQTIGPRNRVVRKKTVSFAPSATQKIARKKVKKYRRQRQKKKAQTSGSLIGNLAKWGINMGAKAINSVLGKNSR